MRAAWAATLGTPLLVTIEILPIADRTSTLTHSVQRRREPACAPLNRPPSIPSVGRAMLQAARDGGAQAIVEPAGINRLAQAAAAPGRP